MNWKEWKRCFCEEFSRLPTVSLWVTAGLCLFFGILIACSGFSRYHTVFFFFPRGALPRFLMAVFWCLGYLLLGIALGAFLFFGKCRRDPMQGQVLLLFACTLLCAYAWIPVVYGAGALFLGILLSVFCLFCSWLLLRMMGRFYRVSSFCMAIFLLWMGYVFYYTLALFLLNG